MAVSFAPQGWKATAAALNRRVSIFEPAELGAGYVPAIAPPEPVAISRRAAILPAGGSESAVAGSREAGDRLVIVLRYERALAGIGTAWTVRNERTKKLYNIVQVDDTESHDRWIYLLCEYGKES